MTNSMTIIAAVTKRLIGLPPDPDGMNDERARLAWSTISMFERATHTDREDSLSDLLVDLMHWADRNELDFQDELDRAIRNYHSETSFDAT